MYGSIAELLANAPDFERMRIREGSSPFRQPILPGEERLVPQMQEKLQPALPPVRKAEIDSRQFLEDYLIGNASPYEINRENELAQLTPKSMPGLERDLEGMSTRGAGPYIRGAHPSLEGTRQELYDYWMQQKGNPLYGGV